MNLHPHFHASSIVRAGRAHLSRGLSGQDHATVRRSEGGLVVAVADGVSLYNRSPSQAQVGAWLAAELVAEGAVDALQRGAEEPGAVRAAASASLHHGLAGVFRQLPREVWRPALITTTILAVVTDRWACVWASGDGFWGVVAPESTNVRTHSAERRVEDFTTFERPGEGFRGVHQALHLERLGELAATASARGPEAAAAELRLVLSADGPVLGLYVATDGLRHEPAVAEAVRLPVRSRFALEGRLRRPEDCDDIAVAWVCERAPGLLGVGALESAGGEP